jgi:catalase
MHEGQMQYHYAPAEHRVYTPNSYGAAGGPEADPLLGVEASWESDGELVRSAATLREDDGDFVQASILYREVFDDEARERFVQTLIGQYNGLTVPAIQERFFWYWGQVDQDLEAQLRALAGAPIGEPEPIGIGE